MTPPIFLVFSDGSGHVDGYGGWCCMARTEDGTHEAMRMGAILGATVDRMEMTAMLEGLQMVREMMYDMPTVAFGESWKPEVKLFSDRENIVLSIQGVYQRNNCKDLWSRFAYYENIMKIHATHVARETDFPEFVQVDLHASTGRIIIKNYAEALTRPAHIIER